MNFGEFSSTELSFSEDLPRLEKALPAGLRVEQLASLPSSALLKGAQFPQHITELLETIKMVGYSENFVDSGPLFKEEIYYQGAVDGHVFTPLLRLFPPLARALLDFGDNIKPDVVITHPVSAVLKMLAEYKSPGSETGGPPGKAENLKLQLAQGIDYMERVLRTEGKPKYAIEGQVRHFALLL